MHAVVMENLESYLSGLLEPAVVRDIEAHLSTCRVCSAEVRSMQDVSALFGSLRAEEVPEAAPGFYARLMRQVGERKPVPTFSGLFALDFAFGRRLAFVSLMTLAVLGSYLVTREAGYPGGPSPEGVMAQQNSPAFDSPSAPDNMLVTLTAYEH